MNKTRDVVQLNILCADHEAEQTLRNHIDVDAFQSFFDFFITSDPIAFFEPHHKVEQNDSDADSDNESDSDED